MNVATMWQPRPRRRLPDRLLPGRLAINGRLAGRLVARRGTDDANSRPSRIAGIFAPRDPSPT